MLVFWTSSHYSTFYKKSVLLISLVAIIKSAAFLVGVNCRSSFSQTILGILEAVMEYLRNAKGSISAIMIVH